MRQYDLFTGGVRTVITDWMLTKYQPSDIDLIDKCGIVDVIYEVKDTENILSGGLTLCMYKYSIISNFHPSRYFSRYEIKIVFIDYTIESHLEYSRPFTVMTDIIDEKFEERMEYTRRNEQCRVGVPDRMISELMNHIKEFYLNYSI